MVPVESKTKNKICVVDLFIRFVPVQIGQSLFVFRRNGG